MSTFGVAPAWFGPVPLVDAMLDAGDGAAGEHAGGDHTIAAPEVAAADES